MLRQQSSRNQRTKGFRVKHALQICLLVAVCIWLLYQVKHSHDKKRAFEERNSRILSKVVDSEPDFFKLGRKDLPHSEDTGSANEVHNKEEEIEEAQEEEEEHETKHEETEDEEGRGAGDDEIDEQDQEKVDEEADHGEESTEEEDKDHQADEADLFDNQDHEGGSQEAREENYKRDDASSAVVHDTHATEAENGAGNSRSTDEEQISDGSTGGDESSADGSKGDVAFENLEAKDVEGNNVTSGTAEESKSDNIPSIVTIDGSVADNSSIVKGNETLPDDNLSTNGTVMGNKDIEVEFSKPDNSSVVSNSTIEYTNQMELQGNDTTADHNQIELMTNSTAGVSQDQTELQNNSTVFDAVTNGVPLSNGTVGLDTTQYGNTTVDRGASLEDKPNLENLMEEPVEKSNTTAGQLEEHPTTSSAIKENGGDAAQEDDSSHGAVTDEERDTRVDLSTLPDIQNEAKTSDDESAE